MKLDIKKLLLAGTALVAVGAFAAGSAQAADLTLGANGTWGSAGGANSTPTTDVTNAAASDNVDITTGAVTLTITNGGPSDGTGANAFVLGAVTDSGAGVGTVDITAGAAADLTATIGSAVVDGAFSLTGADATDADLTVGVTGALTTGTTLTVLSDGDTQQNASALTVGGALTVGTTTAITAGAFAASTATLNADGNTTFTGAVTLTGGAGAGANALLTLSGATNTFTAGVNLATAAKSILTVDGAVAQTVTGVISGAGEVVVTNTHASGVTFAGDSTHTGGLTVNNDGNDQSVTFTGDSASAIALGDNSGADTITANFSGTTQAISGGITGGAAETVNVNFSGGDTITLSGAASSGIDATAISGSTTVTTDQNFTSTATTVGTGSTFATTGNTLTTNITSTGTVLLNGGALTGTLDGAGTLDVDTSATVTGNIGTTTGLTAIDIAAGQTLTVTGDVTATTTTLSGVGTGTLALNAGAHTITGNIVTATATAGAITVADNASTSAIVGNVGTSTATLATLDVAGGAANVLTTTGNLYVDAITVNDADTLSFIGTSAQVVSGTITDGILNLGTGTSATDVTFNGVLASMASSTVAAGATARFDANATVTGTHTNTGTSVVGVGSTLTADVLSDTGSYSLKANDANGTLAATDFGSLADSGANGALTATNVTIDVTGAMTAGTVQLLTGVTLGAATLVDNSIQYGFTVADNGANSDVTVTRATIASLSDNSSTAGAGAALDTLTASTDTQIAAIIDNVASASTADAVDEILEATTSTVDGGAVIAAMGVSNQVASITNTRLAALRNGEVATGMFAGNGAHGLNAWGQVFGANADQDARDGIDGYDADTYGVAFGMDTSNLGSNLVLGLAASYADTEVDSDNANSTKTDVDSYQVTLYGDYDIDDVTYVNGQLSYGFGKVDTSRSNVGGVSGLTATGDYDTDTISARLETGRSYVVSNGMTLTPSVSANYMNYSADDYTETGAGGANLNVDSDNLNLFEIGAGVKASWKHQNANGSWLKPSVHLGVRHDLIGDEVEATNTFTGGGSAFKTEGFDPAQTTFNGGVGVTYYSTTNWNLSANYDAEMKSDYVSHSGLLKAAYKF